MFLYKQLKYMRGLILNKSEKLWRLLILMLSRTKLNLVLGKKILN